MPGLKLEPRYRHVYLHTKVCTIVDLLAAFMGFRAISCPYFGSLLLGPDKDTEPACNFILCSLNLFMLALT